MTSDSAFHARPRSGHLNDLRIVTVALLALLGYACGAEPDSVEPGDSSAAARSDAAIPLESDPAFIQACAQVPGCAEPRTEAPERYETIWRVLVSKGPSGAIEIERAEPIEVPAGDGVPVGPLAGSHLLVGLDNSRGPVEGQWLRFPETLHLEFQDAEIPPAEIDISDRTVDTVGYVRALPSIETLAVLDEADEVVASVPANPKLASTNAGASLFASPAFAQSPPRRGSPFMPPYCAHIKLIEGEEERELAQGIAHEDVVTLVRPGNKQRSNIKGALGLMTPLLCQSLSRIAVGKIPVTTQIGGQNLPILGIVSVARSGDLLLINDNSFPELMVTLPDLLLMKVVIHEAAHSATALLNAESSRPSGNVGAWIPPARNLAERTIANARLELGLKREWESLIRSFQKVGWGKPYGRLGDLQELSNAQLTEGGFMSAYAGVNTWEDIAEVVSWTYAGTLYDNIAPDHVLREDKACMEMRTYSNPDLPSRYTAIYTRLALVEDLGLVHPEDVKRCTGPKLGLPDMPPGFESWREGRKRNSFTKNVSAGIGTAQGGNRVFEMRAEGEAEFGDKTYPATLILKLDLEDAQYPIELVSWPRGIYPLGRRTINKFSIVLEGNMAGSFDSIEGSVLVARASNRRIAGSIFLTKVVEYSFPPTPEVFDPPMIVRFLLKK